MKSIAIFGSTGSIGKSTLAVARHLKHNLQVKALTAYSNIALLREQILEFHPEIVCVQFEHHAKDLKNEFPSLTIVSGASGLLEVALHPSSDFVVMAIVGMSALAPTLKAIEAGKGIGLANKEVLVSAGSLITMLAKQKKVPLLPIDSEHSAIFQCLQGQNPKEISRVILTASGGPFRSLSLDQLKNVSLDEALAHPTWKMGPKVTVDSSTLMNKGLEMIEAHYLFGIPANQIEVVIHPQSVIHSMVEWVDGSVYAQMSDPNMIYPIQYALTYPNRLPGLFPPFDFIKNSRLEFYPPDFQKFPSLTFAYEAVQKGGSFPCFLNAANEVLVDRFLKREISWQGIMQRLEKLLLEHCAVSSNSLDSIFSVDLEARERAARA